jgi:hypothetical protein
VKEPAKQIAQQPVQNQVQFHKIRK